MKRLLSIIISLCFTTSVYASDVKLVSEKQPFFAMFDFFKKNDVAQTSAKTVDTSFAYEDMYNHWGQYAALKLADKNIFKGMEICGKYYFYPDTLLTRADFIVLLMSALGIDVTKARETANPFADATEIPAWANLYAKAAYDAGIISGALEHGKLYFHPHDTLTRIEIIKILDGVIKPYAMGKSGVGYADMYLVPDWGIDSVQSMTDYGILKGYDDNTVRPYVKINRAMAAEFILQLINYKNSNPQMMKQIYAEMNKAASPLAASSGRN